MGVRVVRRSLLMVSAYEYCPFCSEATATSENQLRKRWASNSTVPNSSGLDWDTLYISQP